MLFLRTVTVLSALRATFVHAGTIPVASLPETPESALVLREADTANRPGTLATRLDNNCPPGEVTVYRFPNSSGSYALLCVSRFVVAGCLILIGSGVITRLASTIVGWIKGGTSDASDAGPQVKVRDSSGVTWGSFYNYTLTVPAETAHSSIVAAASNAGIPSQAVTAMAIHEDGFSASFDLSVLAPPGSTSELNHLNAQASCNEQVHVHYWAAAGHTTTALDTNGVSSLVTAALNDSYDKNYGFACYELSNGGAWDGWIRVCYNHNFPQPGCGVCGGHNN